MQQLLWENAGIMRDGEGLTRAADALAAWQETLPPPVDRLTWEMSNLILAGRLMTESALLRQESRGAHYRSDYPEVVDIWRKHIIQVHDG